MTKGALYSEPPSADKLTAIAGSIPSGGASVPVIVTDSLVKQYGKIVALKGVSLSVERGEIFGLLGQNGAGKTTLIKILLGILNATDGSATLLEEPVGTVAVRRRVGYLPEDHRFPDYHTGASLLEYYGTLLEMPRSARRKRIPEILETVGIKGRMDYKIRTYSKGMKQRLGIAQALMHDPEVIFLDEPTDGVDPVGRREIRQLMTELKARGTTIFLNSHLLGEVELICDRVAILDRGEVIRQGGIHELTRQKGTFVVGLAGDQVFPFAEAAALGYNSVHKAGLHWEVGLVDGQTIDPLLALLQSRGLNLRHLVEKRQTLEDLFVQTVEAAEPGIDAPVRRRRPRHESGEDRAPRAADSRGGR
jgi:ABC-2 type transport system ATP-binding protein